MIRAPSKHKNIEKSNNYREILDFINEHLSVFLKVTTSVSIILGLLVFISIYHYFREENINLFGFYSSLASVLPAIIFVDLLIGLLLITLVFFPAWFIYDWNRTCNGKGFGKPIQGIDWNRTRNGAKSATNIQGMTVKVAMQYFFLTMVPFGMGVLDTVPEWCNSYFFLCLSVYSALFVCGFSYFRGNTDFLSLIVSWVVASLIILSAILSAYFLFPPPITEWGFIVWTELTLLSMVLVLVNLNVRTNPSFIFPFSISIASVIAFVFLLITPFSTIISKPALRLLGIGGGVEGIYYVNDDNLSKVPSKLIDEECCVEGFCLTKMISMKWGVGDPIYVSLSNAEIGGAKQSIALPRNILLPYNLPIPVDCMVRQNSIVAMVGE